MMASKGSFKPGLFDLGLNIQKKLSSHYLNIDRKQFIHYAEIEPNYIKPAIRNMLAVQFFHIDIGRTRARLMLEELLSDHPDELNALADLIYVYKEMGREKDAEKYKSQLEFYADNLLCQARRILGQAYALTYDWADDHNKNPKCLLKDSWRLFNLEDNHTEQLIKSNNLVVEAYKVLNAIPETAHEKKIKAKEKAIEKFEKGIGKLKELNCSKEEISTWKHNLAIARSRLDTWRNREGNTIDTRSDNCIKALEDHSYVIDSLTPIENLEKPLQIYLAKSCIFFVQLYTSRKDNISKHHMSECVKKKVQNLESLESKAIRLCPDDNIVLQNYGRIKSNRQEYLEAIEIYNKSIERFPDKDFNWFSYSSRRAACYFHSKKLIDEKSDEAEINKYLTLAYKDGEVCLQSKCTQYCMFQMAQICFERAMPIRNSAMSFDCQNINFIYEALEILHETLNKRDIKKDAKIYAELGKYYLFIGEYRKSIESIKTALELNKWNENYSECFSHHCTSFMCFYNENKDRNLLSEFRYMLKEAKQRQCDKWVTDALKTMETNFPEMLSNLIENMIEWDARGCEDIVKEILQSEFSGRDDMRKRFKMKLQEGSNQESNINGPAEIQASETSESFKYDFFVLHSEKDKEWVNFMLRPQLEECDDVINFRGCFPSRDFIPGERILNSMSKGINNSRKLLIILTPNNNYDKEMEFYKDVCIHSMIESKAKEKTVIPIILKNCEIPQILQPLVPIDFTQENDWDRLRMALTVNMDSMLELEQKMSALNCMNPDEDEN